MSYEEFIETTDISNHELQFYLDGMSEEHGELIGIFKRVRRGDYGEEAKRDIEVEGIQYVIENYPAITKDVQKELGDYDWYKLRFEQNLGWSRKMIDKINWDKLAKRKEVGKIMGHGDERENEPS